LVLKAGLSAAFAIFECQIPDAPLLDRKLAERFAPRGNGNREVVGHEGFAILGAPG
jgi:hypothetical protein